MHASKGHREPILPLSPDYTDVPQGPSFPTAPAPSHFLSERLSKDLELSFIPGVKEVLYFCNVNGDQMGSLDLYPQGNPSLPCQDSVREGL